jgi:hypothetical protein
MIFPYLPKGEDESDENFEDRQKEEKKIINILNLALANIYGENYSISDFMSTLTDNPEALTILNSSSEVRDNDITIFTDINNDGKEILIITKILSAESITIPLFPGQAPDAEDLHFTNYYIYDPDVVDHSDSAIFEYVGQDYSDKFVPAYDETC